MSDTPIIDAAVKAAGALRHNTFRNLVIAALRAGLQWEPSAETIAAMVEAFMNGNAVYEDDRAAMQDVYCAQPIMRELYPERFR